MSEQRRWLTIGWDPSPGDIADERRWVEAIPKICTALAEVGHRAKLTDRNEPDYRSVIQFEQPWPDSAILLKAAQVVGVKDIMDHILNGGCRCHLCKLVVA